MIEFGQLKSGKLVPAVELDPPPEPRQQKVWNDCRGAVIPDLVNVYFTDGDAYVWFAMQDDGGGGLCLEEEEDVDDVGELCPILEMEKDQSSWEDMMVDMPWGRDGSIVWAIENGLAPGQPFLMRFGEPEYTGGGYYEPYDVEYDSELIRVIPWETERAAAAWEEFLKSRKEWFEYRDKRNAEVAEARRTQVDKMYVTTDVYFAPGQHSWDEMEMPRGIRYHIGSSYRPEDGWGGGFTCLASGESNEGDHRAAMDALVKAAAEKLPHLSEETIRNLPRRYYG